MRQAIVESFLARTDRIENPIRESLGQLVRLGCGIAACTPASYQRPRLGRPSRET